MSDNLLTLLKEYLSDDVVSNLATLIGTPPANAQVALKIALPSLLAGLIYKSTNSQTNNDLFDLIRNNHDTSILSNLGAISKGGEETTKVISSGTDVLNKILGYKTTRFTRIVAFRGSFDETASSSFLGVVTAVVIALFGKKLKIADIQSPTSFAEFIAGQGQYIDSLVPPGMVELFSNEESGKLEHTLATTNTAIAANQATEITGEETISPPVNNSETEVNENISPSNALPMEETLTSVKESFDETLTNSKEVMEDAVVSSKEIYEDALNNAKETVESLSDSASELGSTVINEGKEFAQAAASKFDEGAGEGSKLLPWLLILAALALAWGLLKSCAAPTDEQNANTSSITTETQPTSSAVPSTESSSTPLTSESGTSSVQSPPAMNGNFEKTLSTGYALKAKPDGFISKLVGFIENNEPINKDLWFSMDGITFDTGKSTIKAESETQINDISEILEAFQKVKIKIGGYTDNIGYAKTNITLSSDRANAIRAALVAKGIDASRIEAEGYGSEHPVASNDTEAGRQQNRRIDVRVTEK